MKIIRSISILVLLMFVLIRTNNASANAEKIFKENIEAVVVVVALDSKGNVLSQGSGFIVKADGAVVTNYHVISDATDIKIKTKDKVLDVKGVIYTDKKNDLVVLKIEAENLPVVKLGDIKKSNIGEPIYIISSPLGFENTISDGILSGIRKTPNGRTVLQITAPISSGSSGSPVINKKGEVIGITTFLVEDAQNLNFAMPVNLIKNIIDKQTFISLKNADIDGYKKTSNYWLTLGTSYEVSGKLQDALEAYKQAVRISPDNIKAHFNVGSIYNALGRYEDEIASYTQILKIKPNDALAYISIAGAHETLGRKEDAMVYYKRALNVNPDDNVGHLSVAFAYEIFGNYQDAVESYKKALQIEPGDADTHYYLGMAHLKLNDRVSALQEFKILKDINKEKADKLFQLIYPSIDRELSEVSVDSIRAPNSTIDFLTNNLRLFEAMSIILKSTNRASIKQFLLSKDITFVTSETQGKMIVDGYSTNDIASPIIGYSLFFNGDNGPLVIVDATINPLNEKATHDADELTRYALDSTSASRNVRLYFMGIYDLDINRIVKILVHKSETSVWSEYAVRYAVQNVSTDDDLNRLSNKAERINNYFVNAVRVYALKGELDARLAALTAAKVAASVQRYSMVEYLDGMASDVASIFDEEVTSTGLKRIRLIELRLLSLKREIKSKDWLIQDILEAKRHLLKINKDYADALDLADPSIFAKYHPELFKQ